MTTQEKSEAILRKIVEVVDAPGDGPAVMVTFSRDWGPHSLTVELTGRGHTHCGSFDERATWEGLVDSLHSMFNGGPGLSFI